MKKRICILLSLTMLLGLLSGCGRTKAEDKYVYIGVIEPMTGDKALYGNWERLGIEYARTIRQTVNINGESYIVRLVEKDTESSVERTVYAARELAEAGVSVVLGTYGSTECSVAAPDLQAANISAIGITCTDPLVTTNHPNYYRVCYLDGYQGMMLAQYAYSIGARNVYCLAQNDRDYDQKMCNDFIAEFKAMGGSVITSVAEHEYNTYSTNLNDFADFLNGAINNKADLMFAPIPLKKAAQLVGECVAANVTFNLLGDDTWDDPSIGEAVLQSYQAVNFASPFCPDLNETNQIFVTGFKDWLEADPRRLEANGGVYEVNSASALAYDAYMVALDAIELASSADPAAVGEAIKGVMHEGLTGTICFDGSGDANKTEMFFKGVDNATGSLIYNNTLKTIWRAPEPTEEDE